MGASQFTHVGTGKTVQEAFNNARDEAYYDYGHAGYTGTLAEKSDYIEIEVPEAYKEDVGDYVDRLLDTCDGRVDDKWGPAGACKMSENQWIFFGWASS